MRKKTTNYAKYSSIGMQMLGIIGLGTYAGVKLDEWQGNKIPGWTLALSLLSIAAALYNFIRQVKS
ncbi:AtpZ/AtpI family protein [Runella rosea]|nr:AtpZ/AtpI family protein [Runella rosea]